MPYQIGSWPLFFSVVCYCVGSAIYLRSLTMSCLAYD